MGTLFAAYPTENVGEVMSILNIVRLPLIFISGVFIPIASMPAAGQVVALFSPLTYGNDLINEAYTGTAMFGTGIDIVVLLVFIVAFQVVGNRLYRKFNE
jgi:ABC-2 type transport system permease protein